MGRRRQRGRKISGVLLLDKPKGLSSNHALQRAKRLFDAQKAGHTGSLDPLASGLLPLCFGEATKLSGYLLDSDKTYVVRARLGEKTDTGDAEGAVTVTSDPSGVDLSGVLDQFRGDIMQIPPMYSAVKHEGKRLYELARQGIVVERQARPLTIHRLEMLGQSSDDDGHYADFNVRCSKGTYIRTLMEDVAEAAGTHAHVIELRRTAVGPFGDTMVTLDQLAAEQDDKPAMDARLLPSESAVDHLIPVEIDADLAFYVRQGQAFQMSGTPTEGLVRIMSEQGRLIGIGQIGDDGKVEPKRLLI